MSEGKKIIVDIEISDQRIAIHSSFRFDSRFYFVDKCPGVDSSQGYRSYSLTVNVGRIFDPVKVAANLLLEILGVLDVNEVETVKSSSTNIKVLIEANLMMQEAVIESMESMNEASEEEKKGLKGYLEKLEDELDELYNEMEGLDDEA
jgi:hypothetical protein